jgi:hypothetical protein
VEGDRRRLAVVEADAQEDRCQGLDTKQIGSPERILLLFPFCSTLAQDVPPYRKKVEPSA